MKQKPAPDATPFDRSFLDAPAPLPLLNVGAPLMARVKNSRLQLSESRKAGLIGFSNMGLPQEALGGAGFRLGVRYQYGSGVYAKTYDDEGMVLLP